MAQAGLAEPLAERRVGLDGDLERPPAEPPRPRAEARRRRRETGGPVEGRQAERGWLTIASLTCGRSARHARARAARRRCRPATMLAMQPPPASSPEPGERRRLDHPPSDRYGSAAPGGDGGPDAVSEPAADASPLPDRERVLRGIAVGLGGAS